MNRPELLIPAGNLEKLRTAILYGADAVYVGVEGLSLRAQSSEFTHDDLRTGVDEAHQRGVKVYAATNIFARNSDLPLIQKSFEALSTLDVDGVILSDPGVLQIVKETAPKIPIHLSTQANTTNAAALRFWKDQGIQRVVLARELNLKEVSEIAAAVPEVELELFIHGAMCMAISGRCLLSYDKNRRSANLGDCTHPCRWEYQLVESTRPEEPLHLEDDQRYSYLLSSKDLCLIEYLPEVLRAGVVSLKVEGRMKSAYYVAAVTRVYRRALDTYLNNPEGYTCRPEWLEELAKVPHRSYTTGFYFSDEHVLATQPMKKAVQTHHLAGTVLRYDNDKKRLLIELRNRLTAGDKVDLLLPDDILPLDTIEMTDEEGQPIAEGHNGYRVFLPCNRSVPEGAVLRREAP